MGSARIRGAVRALAGKYPEPLRDMPAEFMRLYERCAPFTMTSWERMYALHEAAKYISRSDITGDVVECGVWRGGSSMLAALALAQIGDHRQLWLYDTFAGMPPPSERDADNTGRMAAAALETVKRTPGARNCWAYATLDDVQQNMRATGYPPNRINYIVGRVEDTIPDQAPERIALLRLDTDWYESTRHELETLYPRLSPRGVLIIDDYGHWQGARQAVDEYLATLDAPPLLMRVDYAGRVVVKPG